MFKVLDAIADALMEVAVEMQVSVKALRETTLSLGHGSLDEEVVKALRSCVPRKTIERLIAVCEAAIALYDDAGDVDDEKDALGALMIAVRGEPYRQTKLKTTKPNRKKRST